MSNDWRVEIDHDSGATITPSVLTSSRLEPRLKDQPRARIDVPRDEAYLAEGFEGSEMAVYKDGRKRAIDELEEIVIEPDRDELIGYGATDLEKDVQVDVDDEAVHELVAELIDEHTDLVADIDDPEAVVDEGVIVAEADDETSFDQLMEIAADDDTLPIERTESGGYRVLQTAFVASEIDGPSGRTIEDDDDFIGGTGVYIEDQGDQMAGQSYDGTPAYRIPSEHVGIAVRDREDGDGPDWNFTFKGETNSGFGGPSSFQWGFLDPIMDTVPDVEPDDSLLLAIEATSDGTDRYELDAVIIFDRRFHDSSAFDNDLHEPQGGIDYPGNYPDEPFIVETDAIEQFRTAIAGKLTVDAGPVGFVDRLELSADNGANWIEATDTDVVEGEFDESGPLIRGRISLGNWEPEPRDETPRLGYEPQEINSLEIAADLDNTPLIINQTFESDLVDVLSRMADQTDAVWEVWQDGDDQVFSWTWPGQRDTSRTDAISDYSVRKHTRRTLRCKVRGSAAPVNGETLENVPVPGTVDLDESDVVRGKETVRDANGDRLRPGLDYDLHASDGTISFTEDGRVSDGDTLEIDYEFTVTGTWGADEWSGDPREAQTVSIPAARSERAAQQAARVIVEEHKTPRWEANVTLAYDDIQDIRLSDTLDLEGVPGEAEVVYEIEDEAIEGGLSLVLGNQRPLQDTVSGIEDQLSAASDLV